MASKEAKAVMDVDEQLTGVLRRCRVGDRDGQRQLYEFYSPMVFRLMVRMIGSQEAPDLMQQVFLQVFRKIEQFAGDSKFETWIYRIAANEALQHLRKQHRWNYQTLAHDPMSRQRSDYERSEQQEVLELALARLDPDLRSTFLLREIEGLPYREIAIALEIPEGTVGSRLNHARRELKKHLKDLGWQP